MAQRENPQRIIMGVDPGTSILGYGVILVDKKRVHYVDMGVIDLRKEKDHFLKLRRIFTEIGELMDKYAPDDLAIEAPFYGKNPQVMLKLGRAQGSAIAAALHRGIRNQDRETCRQTPSAPRSGTWRCRLSTD